MAVVVPARDEATTLPRLLGGLAAQRRPADELVVVDDESTDETVLVAEAGGARVLTGAELPDGWAGKPWACAQGAGATAAERLVFLDADVELDPEALTDLLATHDRVGGLLSVVPRHRVERLYEHLSVVPNVVSVMGAGAALPRPARSPSAFGPCLVCHREDYDRVGGHATVAASVLEDVDLGRRFRAAGLPVTVLGGRDRIGYRMYPGGVRPLVEGWTKNLAGGAGRIPVWRSTATALWVTALLGVLTVLPDGGLGALTAYGLAAAQVEVLARRVGAFRAGVGLAHPVLSLAFLVLFVGALVLAVRGQVRWKGRQVPVRP